MSSWPHLTFSGQQPGWRHVYSLRIVKNLPAKCSRMPQKQADNYGIKLLTLGVICYIAVETHGPRHGERLISPSWTPVSSPIKQRRYLLGDHSPRPFVFLHVLWTKALAFQGYLCNKQPRIIETVPPSRVKGRQAFCMFVRKDLGPLSSEVSNTTTHCLLATFIALRNKVFYLWARSLRPCASIHETMAGSLVTLQRRKQPRPFPGSDTAMPIGLLCRGGPGRAPDMWQRRSVA